MNFGTQDIQDIIYQQVKKAGYHGGIPHGKFAKDTAKLIYALMENEMDPTWNVGHNFPPELEEHVRRFENLLGMLLKRTSEAQTSYEYILEQEKEGHPFERFAEWAKGPDRRQYLPKYFSKPEYFRVDYLQAFSEQENQIQRNADGSLNV